MLISFPGGKCDPTDQDVVHTALRETHEELGLTVPEEHVWGVLRPVHDRVRLLDPEATSKDKEGGHGLWQADIMVEHLSGGHVPSPHNPPGRGQGYLSTFSRGIPRLGSGARGGPGVSQLCPAWWRRVGEDFTG